MSNKSIVDLTTDKLKSFLESERLSLYDVVFKKEGGDYFLRVYIDRLDDDYVSTEDCEKVSRYLSKWLDEDDPIDYNYYLEVSSPGLQRVLTKPEHFEAALGKTVEVKLYKAIDGEKLITSNLKSYNEHEVTIENESGSTYTIALKDIAKINIAVTF